MNNEIVTVKTFFESIQVHLSNIWLESCINWCKSEVLGANYTIKELQSKVYEQWLLLDLRDVEVPCLPPNLSSQKYFILKGNFCLQMMQVVDISKPKLWQLQKIRNSNILTRATQQDSETVGTGKRLLQLRLTDGVQEVEAMEYRPISQININLAPGVKIRIMGPVTVRRGRLMLEQENVKILGGEVEELLVSHAAENVLARCLKLPENPNPGGIEEKALSVEVEEEETREFRNNSINKPKSVSRPAPVTCTKVADEDEILSREINLLLEAEKEFAQPNRRQSTTPDLFQDEFPDNFDDLDDFTTSTQVGQPQSKEPDNNVPSTSLMDEDDDVFNEIDIDAQLDEIDKKSQPKIIPGSNVLTISKLIEMQHNITRGMFRVKAKFKSVVEKLTIGTDEYKLVIKIEDDTGDLIVKLHSDVVANFTGYTPSAILSLKNNILEEDKEAVEKVMQAMQKVKDRLVQLNHVVMIQIVKDEVPMITKINE